MHIYTRMCIYINVYTYITPCVTNMKMIFNASQYSPAGLFATRMPHAPDVLGFLQYELTVLSSW